MKLFTYWVTLAGVAVLGLMAWEGRAMAADNYVDDTDLVWTMLRLSLEKETPVHVMVEDAVKDGCWTTPIQQERRLNSLTRAMGFNVQPKEKAEWERPWVYLFVSGHRTDSGNHCIGHVQLEIQYIVLMFETDMELEAPLGLTMQTLPYYWDIYDSGDLNTRIADIVNQLPRIMGEAMEDGLDAVTTTIRNTGNTF